MCRNIRLLNNFKPPVTDEEVRIAAIHQQVRKISRAVKPPQINQKVFISCA